MTRRAAVLLGGGAVAAAAGLVAWWTVPGAPDPAPGAPPRSPAAPPDASGPREHRADAPWGTVRGRVADADGRAVAGATVVAQDLQGLCGLATTGDDGSYSVELVPWPRVRPRWPDRGFARAAAPQGPADVVVAARADGFTRSNVRRATVARGGTADLRPLVLYRGGRIEGRIVDRDGRELAGRVRVVSVTHADAVEGLQALPPAHPEGFVASEPGRGFAFEGVGPGDVELWATAPGAGGSHGRVAVAERGTTRVDLPIDLRIGIGGRVVGPDGAGAAGVRVSCVVRAERADTPVPAVRGTKPRTGEAPSARILDDDLLAARGAFGTDTDADGRFHFYGLRDDARYTVAVPGAPAASVRDVTPGTTDLVLRIAARSALRVCVTDAATGAPLERCGVRVLAAESGRFLRLRHPLGLADAGRSGAATDADGLCELADTFPGRYRVVVTRAGYEVAEAFADVSGDVSADVPAAVAPVAVALVPAASLDVEIVDAEGRAVAGADVSVAAAPRPGLTPMQSSESYTGRLHARTDAAGAASFGSLPADEALVLRVRDDDGRSARVALTLGRSERRRATVALQPPATLVVRVRPRTSGSVEGHPVRVVGIDDPDIDVAAATDADGVARITRIPPGRVRVLATDPEEDPARDDVARRVVSRELAAGAEATDTFEIADVARVGGRVTRGGAPVRGGRVGFGPLAGTADHHRPLLFDVPDGAFEGRVPPGRYHVHVAFPGTRVELPDPVEIPAAPAYRLDLDL